MRKVTGFALVICASMLLASCGGADDVKRYAREHIYADFDVAKSLGLSLPSGDIVNNVVSPSVDDPNSSKNDQKNTPSVFRMRVYDKMDIYNNVDDLIPYTTLSAGTEIDLREIESSQWAEVYDVSGDMLGYAKDGFMHALDSDLEVYAELPVEYGTAKTNDETYVQAYSHLVDIRKYLNTYSSLDESNEGVDLSKYDIKVSMKLATSETSISEPFYQKNICMVQYDILPQLKKAIEIFRNDGYMIVIYDAYRPTSVQQRWFDVVRVHKWVADPSIGMGGIHDRGTALDISLIDISTGEELEMPTPMHTFTEESARSSDAMTDTARANMDYMMNVMVSCGFTYINSEWWHFQTADTQYYLPTDHPIDTIPLVASETIEN